MKLTWSHAFVPVENLNEMVDFYTGLLGFNVSDRIGQEKDGNGVVFLSQDRDAEHHQLAFASASELPKKAPAAHFAFRTTDLDTVKALALKLKAADESMTVKAVSHGNTWSIYFRDPESNGIEVFCDTPWMVDQPCSFEWNVDDDNDAIHQSTLAAIKDRPDFADNPRVSS